MDNFLAWEQGGECQGLGKCQGCRTFLTIVTRAICWLDMRSLLAGEVPGKLDVDDHGILLELIEGKRGGGGRLVQKYGFGLAHANSP